MKTWLRDTLRLWAGSELTANSIVVEHNKVQELLLSGGSMPDAEKGVAGQ